MGFESGSLCTSEKLPFKPSLSFLSSHPRGFIYGSHHLFVASDWIGGLVLQETFSSFAERQGGVEAQYFSTAQDSSTFSP